MMDDVTKLAELLRASRNTVFFGGAGVSTESGIPDFRSESGLYAAQQVYGHSPEELLSHTFFVRNQELFFRYYKENLVSRDALPNEAHLALAKLESAGMLSAVVTQNIDGLHQLAGSRNVLELHGSNWRQYCVTCGARYTLGDVMDSAETVPHCSRCGGVIRPEVVLYEEGLDDDVVRRSTDAIARAEVLIVGGTSLAVYPAAGLLRYFKGRALVLINKSVTPVDSSADIVIHAPIGAVLKRTVEMLNL
ncbi:MAG: NAD-dependent protein deacylase [Oscillospiraceae bacterium]|jgi:NAD-dependent deacetylase|nr:NAD-dependent protein deacylase [Oscillospiraceae bacterium]